MIIVDTREKKNNHILEYFKNNNIDYKKECLNVADYINTEKPYIVIERKQNLLELAGNISKDNAARIKREFSRLKPECKMIILIEEKFNCLEDVVKWSDKHSKMYGATLYRYLLSWKYKHNIDYIFCDKKETGKVIAELLGVMT